MLSWREALCHVVQAPSGCRAIRACGSRWRDGRALLRHRRAPSGWRTGSGARARERDTSEPSLRRHEPNLLRKAPALELEPTWTWHGKDSHAHAFHEAEREGARVNPVGQGDDD